MKPFRLFTSVFALLIFSVACKKSSTEEEDLGYNFVPFQEGFYQIYQVDSISYDIGSDTASYQLKEVVGEVFEDELGRTSRKLYRYKRPNDTAAWVQDIVYYAFKDISRYERVENDQRKISLVFPVRNGKTWDENELNPEQTFENEINNVGAVHSVLGVPYNNTLQMVKLDEFNFIQYKYIEDYYAYGVGLIEKTIIDLEINGADINNISRGVKYYQKLISYGIQ